VNLEYDADEESLLAQAAAVFRSIAPLDRAAEKSWSAWRPLVDAGWSELGASVEDGSLSLGLAAGLHRLAGQQLLVEQFVTSGYVLSALAAHTDRELAARLHERPGVLLGDGRDGAIPVGSFDTGWCFGVEGEIDAYRVVEGFALEYWDGEVVVSRAPELSPSVGTVALGTGSWTSSALDLGRESLDRIATDALLVHSAGLVGVAEQLLTITRDYTLAREQFGAPIGSYQAVKHALADVYSANTVAWNSVLSAVAAGADRVTAPMVARYLSVEAALISARAGAQFHGGMGFTAELNVHRFLKAVLDGGQRFGSHDEFAAALSREMVARAC
jgi:hypothetical protein